jgi:hypothetical protein
VNEPTEIGRTNEALRRRWGISGGPGPILTFATDAFPITSIDETTMDPEQLYLCSSRRASQRRGIDPAPGQFGVVGIFAPPAGNTFICVERIHLESTAAAASYQLAVQYPGAQAITSTVAGTLHDSRWAAALSTGLMGTASVAAQYGSVVAIIEREINRPLLMDLSIILAPGGQFSIQGPVDVTFGASIFWRERTVSGNERA